MSVAARITSSILALAAVSVPAIGQAAPTTTAGASAAGERAVVRAGYNGHLKRKILVDGGGMTLYMFDMDYLKFPTCYDDATYHCAQSWPPVLTQGAPIAGKGIKRKLLGTVKRTDGTVQVMYAKHPLYRFAGYDGKNDAVDAPTTPGDTVAGDVNGQDFLGLWWVLAPTTGRPIHTPPP